MLIGLYIIRNKAKFKLKTYEKFLEEKLNLKWMMKAQEASASPVSFSVNLNFLI